MFSFKKFIAFLKNPQIFPASSVVTVQQDGLLVDDRKITYDQIISVVYFSIYSENEFPPEGRPGFAILTTQGEVLYFSEKDENLITALNANLESWKGINHYMAGQVLRWKQHGKDYKFVNKRDKNSFSYLEPLTKKIHIKYMWLLILVFLLVCFGLFFAMIWPAISRY